MGCTGLFGTRQSDGGRISKLASYTGRGSLEGWLRTVLAQEYINRYRGQRRLVSFEERSEAGEQFEAKDATAAPADPRLEQAVDAALIELSSEERWLLASWYLDGRTLAEIARMLASTNLPSAGESTGSPRRCGNELCVVFANAAWMREPQRKRWRLTSAICP